MLDSVEKTIKPGHGRADVFVVANRDVVGGGAEVAARVTSSATVFARGWIGSAWDRSRIEGEAIGGVRWLW